MQFYFHTKQKSAFAFHLCWKVTMALLWIISTLSLILFLISWQHHWTWELLSSWQQEEQAPRTSGAQHLCVRDVRWEMLWKSYEMLIISKIGVIWKKQCKIWEMTSTCVHLLVWWIARWADVLLFLVSCIYFGCDVFGWWQWWGWKW